MKEYGRRWRERNRKPCKQCGASMGLGKQGLQYCSKECVKTSRRAQDKVRRQTLRAQVAEHKTSIGCSRCGYSKSGAALDWHHLEDNKERRLTVRGYFTILGELERAKCVLLCANCHREEHNE